MEQFSDSQDTSLVSYGSSVLTLYLPGGGIRATKLPPPQFRHYLQVQMDIRSLLKLSTAPLGPSNPGSSAAFRRDDCPPKGLSRNVPGTFIHIRQRAKQPNFKCPSTEWTDKYDVFIHLITTLLNNKKETRSSLVAYQLRTWHCHCCGLGYHCGLGSIPGPGTSACHLACLKKKEIKKVTSAEI